MGSFVRRMVSSSAPAGGTKTLVLEVSDSLHLRRFCLLPLTQRVPDESTVRKLVRRLGPEVSPSSPGRQERDAQVHHHGVQGQRKGTHAKLLAEHLDLEHISVGDIFRWNVQHHTKLGAQVRAAWPPASWSTTTWSARWSTGA